MSTRSRARHLSSLTGWSYQRSLQEARKVEPKAKALASDYNWLLKRAVVLVVNPQLDEEYNHAAGGLSPTATERCAGCDQVFFVGVDSHGVDVTPRHHCPDCVEEHGLCHCETFGTEWLAPEIGDPLFCDICRDRFKPI